MIDKLEVGKYYLFEAQQYVYLDKIISIDGKITTAITKMKTNNEFSPNIGQIITVDIDIIKNIYTPAPIFLLACLGLLNDE